MDNIIGRKIEENMQLHEFIERVLGYAFTLAVYGEYFIEDICDEMGITEDEMYELFRQLGYEKEE